MARPIRETPILFGEEGRRFEEKMRNAKCTISDEEYADNLRFYEMAKKAFEGGDEIIARMEARLK